jgi:hypothetical protein
MEMVMKRIRNTLPKSRILRIIIVSLLLTLSIVLVASAASTAKILSTNFTLINFGSSVATVHVDYYKDDGSTWTAEAGNTDFTLPANGGQKIIRQYFDNTLTTGQGSSVISSTEPLGSVVQIQARGQTPTSGAYSGFSSSSDTFYVPLVTRRLWTASGLANSQIMIQNIGASSTTVDVEFIGTTNWTRVGIPIPASSTYYYDIEEETNLSENWYGSAVVTAAGTDQIVVVSNFFTGEHTMQTFNAFPAEDVGTSWLVPLFTSRLANSLSTVIAVQNLSGGSLAIGAVDVDCIKDGGSPGTDFSMSNTSAIPDNGSYYFNPVTDMTIQAEWYGACRITSTGGIVSFVQMRYVPGTFAAAYEAIKGDSTDTNVFVPLVAKRLANGFATVATIQNLNPSSTASVTFTYIPSPDYVLEGGSSSNIVVGPYTIPAGGSLLHNHRLVGAGTGTGQHNLPDLWYGSLTVSSSDQPIHGFVQLTYIIDSLGDTSMAHNAFTQP